MDDTIIKRYYKEEIGCIEAAGTEIEKTLGFYDSVIKNEKVTGVRRRIPKVAVAALALCGILTISGGAVWAMNSPAIRDYLFGGSEREFNEVYTKAGNEYIVGDHKIVYEGSMYDASVNSGYISFSFWNSDGSEVDLKNKLEFDYSVGSAAQIDSMNLKGWEYKLKNKNGQDDRVYVLIPGWGMLFSTVDNNNMFMKFSYTDQDAEGQKMDNGIFFVILSDEEYRELGLAAKNMRNSKTVMQDNILEKYNPVSVTNSTTPAQIIELENLKLTIGRMDIIFEYDAEKCDINEFIMIRDDGTRIKFKRSSQTYANGETVDGYWKAEGMNPQTYGGGTGSQDGYFKVNYNMGIILGQNEKVSIEAGGKIYR